MLIETCKLIVLKTVVFLQTSTSTGKKTTNRHKTKLSQTRDLQFHHHLFSHTIVFKIEKSEN